MDLLQIVFMAGGLIQVISDGSQDIFLTGSPQITFFKMVYRRHTNFAIDSIEQQFIGNMDFGLESTSIIGKAGDLMSRMYLEIDIPQVDLVTSRQVDENLLAKTRSDHEQANRFYQLVYDYVAVNTDLARKLGLMVRANNVSIENIKAVLVNDVFIANLVDSRNSLIAYIKSPMYETISSVTGITQYDLLQEINQIDIVTTSLSVIRSGYKFHLDRLLNGHIYNSMKSFYMKAYDVWLDLDQKLKTMVNGSYVNRSQFAWIKELGHFVIDHVSISIGNQLIDKHTGDWLSINSKLALKPGHVNSYQELIGNVDILTSFDHDLKPRYKLIVPLQFWFCKSYGVALPLISLQYHDVSLTLKLRDLYELCRISDNDCSVDNLQTKYGLNLEAVKLYVDYVYLDTEERQRFAKSSHEYLIEIVQYEEYDNIKGNRFNVRPEFSHLTKYLVWFVQHSSDREALNTETGTSFGSYAYNDKNPTLTTSLKINVYDRVDPTLPTDYYNYLQPMNHFNTAPPPGLNVYSFAINPLEHQPTGSLNLSRIDDLCIGLRFTRAFNHRLSEGGTAFVGLYAVSNNILRIMSGVAGLSFERSV